MPDPTPAYLFNLAYAAEMPQVETRVALRKAAALIRELQANRPPSHPDTDDAREHCRLAEHAIRRPFSDDEPDDTYFCRTIRSLADALDASRATCERFRSMIRGAQQVADRERSLRRELQDECARLRGFVESQDAVDLAEVLACNHRLVAECERLRENGRAAAAWLNKLADELETIDGPRTAMAYAREAGRLAAGGQPIPHVVPADDQPEATHE